MATERPRVIGLPQLLALKKPLRERPAPLVFFTKTEFTRLIAGAAKLPRRPRGAPLAAFDPWPTGGMVQGKCESPPGQTCFGWWTPAGADHGKGVYFDCRCVVTRAPEPPTGMCRLLLVPSGRFQCTGTCTGGQTCRLGAWRHPATGRYVLDCRCGGGAFTTGTRRAGRARRARRR